MLPLTFLTFLKENLEIITQFVELCLNKHTHTWHTHTQLDAYCLNVLFLLIYHLIWKAIFCSGWCIFCWEAESITQWELEELCQPELFWSKWTFSFSTLVWASPLHCHHNFGQCQQFLIYVFPLFVVCIFLFQLFILSSTIYLFHLPLKWDKTLYFLLADKYTIFVMLPYC